MEKKRRAILDYKPTNIPLSILNEEYQPPEPDVEVSTGGLWDAATERHWISSSLSKQKEDQEVGGIEIDYEAPLDKLQQYNRNGYSQEELEYLSESRSNENFTHREDRIKADREVKRTIESAGLRGTGIELAAAIFDPTMIPLMFAGSLPSLAKKGATVSKIGLSMVEGAGLGSASEYILKQGDTQRTNQDLVLSAVAGMAFSSALQLGSLGLSARKSTLERANIVEGVQAANMRDMEIGNTYNSIDKELASVQPDSVARKRVLSERDVLNTLKQENGAERLDVMSKKATKSLKDEFRAYKKEKLEVIKKIEARPKLRPTARAAEIKMVTDAIDRRQFELDAAIASNKAGLEKNSQLDALQQGKIPESLKARYAELKAERGEFDVPAPKGDDLPKAPVKPQEVEGEAPAVPSQSVGAARSRTEFDDIDTYDELFSESDVTEVTNVLDSARQLGETIPRNNAHGEVIAPVRSMYTELDGAPDDTTRGLVGMTLKNPQRTTAGLQSIEEYSDTLFHQGVIDYQDYIGAFETYIKNKGIGTFNYRAKTRAEEEFNKETVLYQISGNLLSNKPVDGDSPIILGAKARSRLYERGLKYNQDGNFVGFENIKHSHEYQSVVFSQDNIRRMSDQHVDFMEDAIASAYMTGGIKLTRENAVSLAKNQIARTMSVKGQVNKDMGKLMSESQYNKLSEDLRAKGVGEDEIEDIRNSIFDAELRGEISPRAMFSLRPNLKSRSGDVWMVDLIDTSINRNMKYMSDGAANAGLAANGFRSRHQYQRAISAARNAAGNDLRFQIQHYKETGNTKAQAKAEKALDEVTDGKYTKMLDEAIRLIYREPLEDGDGLKDMSRLLRKATSVVRLRTTGLATLPENATAAVRNGLVNTLKQIPQSRYFDLRKSSVTGDKFMNDYSRAFSATGHQEYTFGQQFYNGSDFDDATKGRLEKIQKSLGNALNFTMTVNLFRTFQHGGEEMVARSAVNNLRDMSIKGEITPNIRSSLIEGGGMSDDQVEEMISVFKQYPDMDIFDSVRLMSPQLHNSLSVAMRNNIGHSFLRMSIGEQPAYMNKEMGKMMTTLMSFTIGSYEKMLLRGIKNERAALLAVTSGQAVLGYGALSANTYIQAQNMSGRERDRYIEKRMGDDGLFWGVMARVGVFAAPLVPLQIMNTLGALPEEMAGAGRMGGVQSSALVADSLQAASAGAQLVLKEQNSKEEEQDWNSVKRVLPWYNSSLYNLTVGTATND